MYLQIEDSYMNRSFHFVGLKGNDFIYLIEIHQFAKYVQLHQPLHKPDSDWMPQIWGYFWNFQLTL